MLLLSASLLTACGGTVALITGPSCPLHPPKAAGKGRVFVGSAAGQYDTPTQNKAFAFALTEGLKELGVKVASSTLVSATTEVVTNQEGERFVERSSEEREYSVKLEELEVRRAKTSYCALAGAVPQVRAFVTIPGNEWVRLVRQARAKTALIIGCESEGQSGCLPRIENSVRDAVQSAGFDIAHAEMRSAAALPDAQEIRRLANQHGAAWILIVSLRSRVLSDADPVFAETSIFTRLVETSDGKTIRTWEQGRHEGNNQAHRFKGSSFREYSKRPEVDAMSQSMLYSVKGVDRGKACDADDTFCAEPGLVQGMKAWEPWR